MAEAANRSLLALRLPPPRMPSTQGLERELQETAAILECTDRQFLPGAMIAKIEAEGGRAKLQARLTALKQLVEQL